MMKLHSDIMYKHLLNQRAVSRQEVTVNAHAVSPKTATTINHAHPFITICLQLRAFIHTHTEHVNTYEDFCKMAVLPNTKKYYLLDQTS
jgi:hypothetical protein